MNGVNLPTDNLYKFIALAGLAIMIFSGYFIVTRLEQGTALRNQLDRESALIDVQENQIELALEQLKLKIGVEAKALQSARNEIQRRKAQLGKDAEAATRYLKFSLFLFEYLFIAVYVGIGIAIFGFGLWYWKLQRHMDKAVREQKQI
jgi:fucose permease